MTKEELEAIRAAVREEMAETCFAVTPMRDWIMLRRDIEKALEKRGIEAYHFGTMNNIGYLIAKRYRLKTIKNLTPEQAGDVRANMDPFLDFICGTHKSNA